LVGLERQRQLGVDAYQLCEHEQFFPDLLAAFDAWAVKVAQSEGDLYARTGATFDVQRSHLVRTVYKAIGQLRSSYQAASVLRNIGNPRDFFRFLDLSA